MTLTKPVPRIAIEAGSGTAVGVMDQGVGRALIMKPKSAVLPIDAWVGE